MQKCIALSFVKGALHTNYTWQKSSYKKTILIQQT